MAASKLFDVTHQLAFYGAYHANKWNILIHVFGVPILFWSWQVISNDFPIPSFIPTYHYTINKYLEFDVNFAFLYASVYFIYYFILEPFATVLYAPLMLLSLLTARAYSSNHPDHRMAVGVAIHAFAWASQIAGHKFAEGRSPAIVDNFVGAVVLAPLFVHLELLFLLGYRPTLFKQVQNEVGKEITKFRKADGDKKRAATANLKEL